MNKVLSDIVFNRAIIFILFAFECVTRGGTAMTACGVLLAFVGVCNIIKSARIFMEDE